MDADGVEPPRPDVRELVRRLGPDDDDALDVQPDGQQTDPVVLLARGLAEPSDVLLESVYGGEPLLLVVETNKHEIVRVPLPKEALTVDEGASATQRPRTKFSAGPLPLTVRFAGVSEPQLLGGGLAEAMRVRLEGSDR